jgi:hypothetical protein
MPPVLGVEEGYRVGQHLEGTAMDVPLPEGALGQEGLDGGIDAGGVEQGCQIVSLVGVARLVAIQHVVHHEARH